MKRRREATGEQLVEVVTREAQLTEAGRWRRQPEFAAAIAEAFKAIERLGGRVVGIKAQGPE